MKAEKILFFSFLILGYHEFINANNMSRSYKGSSCYNHVDCSYLGVHTICVANECQCVPHYHINNDLICIRDRGLKETCTVNDECYWGPEMVDKLECNLGVCSCIMGYEPGPGRICVKYFASDAQTIQTIPLLTTIVITITSFIVLRI